VTTDRVFLRLGPNGALGADKHQWILYCSGNAVSFVHSTKLILARCIQEKGIEPSPEGRAALDVLADDFSTWRANPTRRGTPLPSGALRFDPLARVLTGRARRRFSRSYVDVQSSGRSRSLPC
jgi:hypothetical protein